MGAVGEALDHGRVGAAHGRDRARLVVGVLRTGVGRLLVLGSGRERVVHALACGDRADPLPRSDREAWTLQKLDAIARDPRVLFVIARHLPRPIRRVGLGAFLRSRSGAWSLHPCVPRDHHRWRARLVCVAGAAAAQRGGIRTHRTRVLPALQQHPADGRCGGGVRRHDGAPDLRCARPRHAVGRTAVLRPGVPAADPPAAGLCGCGSAFRLEEGTTRTT